MLFKYSMTIPQFMEYQRLKEKYPTMKESDLFTAIMGSSLCLGKTLSNNLGFYNLSMAFYYTSQVFFWCLILVALIKAINNTYHHKKAGVSNLIGCIISIILMLIF